MVLQSYGQPRVIKGLGSYSHQVQTKQGILAGHHFVESSVLQDTSLAGPATFLGFLWDPGRRASNPHGRGLRQVSDALEDT